MSHADSCVRYKKAAREHTITNNYNNEVLGTSMTLKGSRLVKKELGSKFKVKDMEELNYILSMHFDKDPKTGDISLSQQAYLECMLKCFRF